MNRKRLFCNPICAGAMSDYVSLAQGEEGKGVLGERDRDRETECVRDTWTNKGEKEKETERMDK